MAYADASGVWRPLTALHRTQASGAHRGFEVRPIRVFPAYSQDEIAECHGRAPCGCTAFAAALAPVAIIGLLIVALANKLARIAWAVLARDRQHATVQTAGQLNSNGGSNDVEARGSHERKPRKPDFRNGLALQAN
jgi:hypothetical protein